jgi:hypothetical protein
MCSPPIVARQRLGRQVLTAGNTRNSRKTVGSPVFYMVRVVSKKSLWVFLCIPLSFEGNGTLNTFPRQRIVGGFVFYAICIV